MRCCSKRRSISTAPSPYFTWSIHLDGDRGDARQVRLPAGRLRPRGQGAEGGQGEGLPRHHQLHLLQRRAIPSGSPRFFDYGDRARRRRHHGVARLRLRAGARPGALPQPLRQTKELFRAIFERGDRAANGRSTSRRLFLDFLAGNQTYHCTPWGNPTRNVFGWQRPCYLLGEGYAKTFKELMEDTDWDAYGVGNYEKCADCMVHSGFEATAVGDTVSQAVEGGPRRAPRRQDEGRDGARHPARRASARPTTSSTRRRPEAVRDPPGRGRGRAGKKAPAALLASEGGPAVADGGAKPGQSARRADERSDDARASILPAASTASARRGAGRAGGVGDSAQNHERQHGRRRAKRAGNQLSMSTAAAPLARRSSALAAAARTGAAAADPLDGDARSSVRR